tara:strand:+ start:7160 stop:8281 length:1122 start_codon:yes stop_codon:yes gene_type:complete
MSSGNYCSPKNNNSFTCFSNEDLTKIAEYISTKSTNKLDIPAKFDIHNRKKLWSDIQENIGNLSKCSADYCLIKNTDIYNLIGKHKVEKLFRPEQPVKWLKNNTTWLSTIDIRKVMTQYQDKYSDFQFIGPTPIDFDKRFTQEVCVNNSLCNFNLETLINSGKKRIGVIFNLDPHNMSGSHWVSLFIDTNTGGIYFFCSYGVKPNTQIYDFIKKVWKQGNKLIMNRKININNINDQHTVARRFKMLNSRTVTVNDSNFFKKNMLVSLGNFDGNNLILEPTTVNKINNIVNGTIILEKELPQDISNYSVIAMKSFRGFYNDTRFQFKSTECGVYSIYFIESFLKGHNYGQILSNIINDNEINKKRNIYYRPHII